MAAKDEVEDDLVDYEEPDADAEVDDEGQDASTNKEVKKCALLVVNDVTHAVVCL